MNILVIISYIVLAIINSVLMFCNLYKHFSKLKKKKVLSIIITLIFFIVTLTPQFFNFIKDNENIIENKIEQEYEEDFEIVDSENFTSTVVNNLGENYYNDLQIAKNKRNHVALIISIVSLLVIFAIILLYPKIYFEKKTSSIIAGIVIIGIYSFISIFGILPIEIPVQTSTTIPIYENVVSTHLVDKTHYESTVTQIVIGEVTHIDYCDKTVRRPYKSVVFLTDLCIVLIVVLNITSEEKSFMVLIKKPFIKNKNKLNVE